MKMTARDILVLRELYRRGPMVTDDIRKEFFPESKDGAAARKRLGFLLQQELVSSKIVLTGKGRKTHSSASWKLTMQGVELVEKEIARTICEVKE